MPVETQYVWFCLFGVGERLWYRQEFEGSDDIMSKVLMRSIFTEVSPTVQLQFNHSVMSSFCDPVDCSTPVLPVHHQLGAYSDSCPLSQ